MSIRAYKIIEIKTEKTPLFNCWENTDVVECADNFGDGGILEYGRDTVEDVLAKGDLSTNTEITLLLILKDMGTEDTVQYLCV